MSIFDLDRARKADLGVLLVDHLSSGELKK
jgi:hypothetical protein